MMDLNVSPLPEPEDEQPHEGPVKFQYVQEVHVESAVETMRREREERRRRLKREQQDEGSRPHSEHIRSDYTPQCKIGRHCRIKEAPQGWLECPAFGEPIDNIIPSKVPLDETFNESVPPGKRYSSKQVLNKQRKAGREIGLVIDLTNTNRYYSPSEWTNQCIKYVKIPCKGRDAVPDNESANTFVNEVIKFLGLQRQSKNPRYILVHCTHGHNRTGFMIIHYLMRTHVSCVLEAINIFSQRRPPGIYKRDYIEALYKFYNEAPENRTITCPSTPEWKRPDDLDLNGEAKQDDDDNARLPPLLNGSEVKVITNDDVLGDAIPYDQQDELRRKCYQLLGMPDVRGYSQFPGSHPVSLSSDNLQLLRQRYYYATRKADGTRYMMLIMRDGSYLIDRNFCFRRIQMRFPRKNFEGLHEMTLIDGEMVVDKIPGSKLRRRYLAYDLMAIDSVSKTKMPFYERWRILESEIVRPRNYEKMLLESGAASNSSYKYDMELFSVRRKDFWVLTTVEKLLKEFIPSVLSHDADGLIFQGLDDLYVNRTHECLLKWKYPEMNSVDFLFELGSHGQQFVFLYERGKRKVVDGARIAFPNDIDPSSIAGRIVECSWNKEEQYWVCMRIRIDKSTPNDINTFRKVMRSISDNITEEKLLQEIGEITCLPMYADRIAQDLAKMTQHQRR